MNIYNILSSKSTNVHYIKKYLNFIEGCRIRPKLNIEYLESHHVCPKASDLFPEYIDFSNNPWNKIELNAREHVIAHVMLWKIFGGSQTYALSYMLNMQNENSPYENVTGKNRKIPTSILIRYAAKLREEAIELRKGKATYKDSYGNFYFLSIDDPKIEEFGLVGRQFGCTHTPETIQKMHLTKLKSTKVKMWFLTYRRMVKLFSSDYDEHIAQGWTVGLSPEDKEYIKQLTNEKVAKIHSKTCNYMDENGEFFGRLSMDDPLIEELNLKFHVTENHLNQRKRRSELAKEFNTGSKRYNNGVIEKKFKEPPTDPQWIPGRLPRSEEYLQNQKLGVSKRCGGSTSWNNGIIAIRVPKGKTPEEMYPDSVWVRGMLPRSEECKQRVKEISQNRCLGNTLWNNGIINIRIPKGKIPEELYPDSVWIKGGLPRKKNIK